MGITIAILVLGVVLGGLIGYFARQPAKESKQREEELNAQIRQKEEELSKYKHEVAEHFLQTASLVNGMTESYRAVHEHLANGARSLCSELVGVQQLEIKQTRLLDKEAAEEATTIEPVEAEPESIVAREDIAKEPSVETKPEEEGEKEAVLPAGATTAETPASVEEGKRTVH